MDIYTDVVARVEVLGYTVTDDPDADVTYAVGQAEEQIKANINRSEIPEGLRYTWIDMAAGLFLFAKKSAGQLGAGFDFSACAQKITEGDVTVQFFGAGDGAKTPEARFDALLNTLINPPQHIFARFRRLVW